MRPYILAESNWKDLKENKPELAILPWGATEAHNYHLPYGTDVYEAEAIAAGAAEIAWRKNAKVTVLPAMAYGVNTGQHDILLDMNMNPSTQLALLDDMLTVMERQGIYKFLIINSHGGNEFKPLLRQLGVKHNKMFLSLCNCLTVTAAKEYFTQPGDHAGELETSLMMHIKPELVGPLAEAGDGEQKKIKLKSFNSGLGWTERQWSKITADTGVGNPALATAEKGGRFYNYLIHEIAAMMEEVCAANLNDLYEK